VANQKIDAQSSVESSIDAAAVVTLSHRSDRDGRCRLCPGIARSVAVS